MDFEKIRSETHEHGVLLVTLDDPSTLNALGEPLMTELLSEIDRFAADPDLRCLVLTGSGRSFSSGANVRGFARSIEARDQAAQAPPPPPSPWSTLDPMFTASEGRKAVGPLVVHRLHNLQKPSIAAVNGFAYGLGCGLALSCDIRVAGSNARFSEAFIRNGLIPADGSTWQLPKLIGPARTLWMQYTGDAIDATEAERIGIVNKTVPDEQLLETALEMATRLARGPVFSMGMIKQLVMRGFEQDLPEHMSLASRAQDLARLTDDHREGVRAFIEKRDPQFTGR
ncbi:MAG: enoyl-CoA hydratase [Dehalococcoidia bacterium]|nr:enoyl-CoA hydratase [Dehalococcoidia bacterium]